jgi:hypothetical protein
MVVQNADAAVNNANKYTHCDPGMCLKYTRTWLEIGSAEPDATSAWNSAIGKHAGDRNPPRGAPVFWTGGSKGYGHIALAKQGDAADQMFRGTDMPGSGTVSNQQLEWVENHWGLKYAGWAEGFNGVKIPYLSGGGGGSGGGNWRASGDVYVAKLVKGQKDSDSVARLCYRLINHPDMPGSHRPPKQVNNYNQEILEAVRYWQKNIRPDKDGPKDGSKMSNQQANAMFGDNYTVHNK